MSLSKAVTRIFSIILATILLANIFPLSLTAISYNRSASTVEHSFGQYSSENAKEHKKVCSGCGTVEYENHFKKWIILTLPTYYAKGEGHYHCTKCDYVSEKESLSRVSSSKTVSVRFDPNGGTLANTEFTVEKNKYDLALAEEPTREGYCFRGWALSKDSYIPDFFPNEKIFYADDDTVYYAVWRRLYGYSFLDANQKKLYMLLTSELKKCGSPISIPSSLAIKPDALDETIKMIISDHPDYFWFLGGYSYDNSSSTGYVLRVTPKYSVSGNTVTAEEMLSQRTVFHNRVKAILAQMNSETGDSAYERALWIHDKVCELVDYQYGNNHQTAYGALIEQQAVCAGYARLYQYLLNCAGIDAWTLKGKSVDPSTNKYASHAWTLMWLDGHCLYSDVTWDDQSEEKYHIYFALSYEDISKDHIVETTYYADKLPVCCDDGCDSSGYFDSIHPECKLDDDITATVVGNLLELNEDGRSWSCSVFDPNNTKFYKWITTETNMVRIIQTYLPYGSYSCRFRMIGGASGAEVHVTFVNSSLPVACDFTGDNQVDMRDLVRYKRILANIASSNGDNIDLDGNGTVNSIDLSTLRKKLLKGFIIH